MRRLWRSGNDKEHGFQSNEMHADMLQVTAQSPKLGGKFGVHAREDFTMSVFRQFVCRCCGEVKPGPRAIGEHACAECWAAWDRERDRVISGTDSRGMDAPHFAPADSLPPGGTPLHTGQPAASGLRGSAPSVFGLAAAELVRLQALEGAA